MAQTQVHKVRCNCGKVFSNWKQWAEHYSAGIPDPCTEKPLPVRQKAWQRREAYHQKHKGYEIRL